MAKFLNINSKTFGQQHIASPHFTGIQNNNSGTNTAGENTVNNKGLENGDTITMAGKEISKKKAIMGGVAILATIAGGAFLYLHGKGKTPVPQPDDRAANNLANTLGEAAEGAVGKAGDDVVNIVNKAEESIENVSDKIIIAAEETLEEAAGKAGDDIEKAVTGAENKTVEAIKETTETITAKVRSTAEAIDEKMKHLVDNPVHDDSWQRLGECESTDVWAAIHKLKPETIDAMDNETFVALSIGKKPSMGEQEANKIIDDLLAQEADGVIDNIYKKPDYINAKNALDTISVNRMKAARISSIEKHFAQDEISTICSTPKGKSAFLKWIDLPVSNSIVIAHKEESLIDELKFLAGKGAQQ